MRLLITILLLWVGVLSRPVAGAPEISAEELSREIGQRVSRVEEFRYLRAEAEKLGVRVWLFGGTAAAFGHYVTWDLRRERGDSRFQKERFDYDYTNIFRSTQDLDLVVDGPPAAAEALQDLMETKYHYLLGSKAAWEVRLLRESYGDKMALLGNPDFLNQHTDSNSTGLIEVTPPPKGERAVKDLRDWRADYPIFLEDIRLGKLHYYFSDKHETTSRFKEGKNPPILSVIRYLTKAFQYALEITPEYRAQIQGIVDRFDPKRDLEDHYVSQWIEKNGKKLFQHAVNLEYAWDTLESLGLRKKLIETGDFHDTDSLAWWMNKEPMRSFPVGENGKKTAGEMGITEVAHETNNFLAYESITRSHLGSPNVFISRQDGPGEAAAYGDGFYTAIGRHGARGTGLTIRFTVAPEARDGKDFDRHGNYLVSRRRGRKRLRRWATLDP